MQKNTTGYPKSSEKNIAPEEKRGSLPERME